MLFVVVAFTTSVDGTPPRTPTEIDCALAAAAHNAPSASNFLILSSLVNGIFVSRAARREEF